jgi:hypothetical protein
MKARMYTDSRIWEYALVLQALEARVAELKEDMAAYGATRGDVEHVKRLKRKMYYLRKAMEKLS